jgi:succinoglycan biosynthesis protein ExoU
VGAPGAAGAPESAATDGVCVIIAAMNAGGTIARAVASALAERETTEVIVVDDASTDDTAAAARSADDGSGRLRILLHDSNLGPAAARNVAIAASEAPIVTVLDADDYWLPGRLARLVPHLAGCDLVADDLLRVVEGCEHVPPTALIGPELDGPFDLSLAHFAQANISRRGRARRELGFLKPLIRRAFLAQHGLTYDARLRLGEDFVLYAQALACGARFKLVPACGYVAVERAASLSGRHDIGDLQALLGACVALADAVGIGADAQSALARHRRHLRSKILHRRALDLRRRRGAAYALGLLSSDLRGAFYVVGEALIDRLARPRRANKITPSGTFGGTGVPAER